MAKIDVTKIEGFESMTPEQKIEALQNFEYEDFSEDNRKLKASFDKASSEASKYKKQYNDKLTETERAEQERAEKEKAMNDELEGYRKQSRVNGYTAKFMAIGYDSETAKKLAENTPDGASDEWFDTQKKFFDNQKQLIEKTRIENQPQPKAGGTPSPETVDTSKMTDKEYFDYIKSKKNK